MINRSLFINKVSDKIKTLALEAFVHEAFTNALPFNVKNLSNSSKKELTKYSISTLEALGGYHVLEKALESETDPRKKNLLMDIDNICTEAANKTALRVANEDAKELNSSTANMEELVRNSGFTPSELDKFKSSTKEIDFDRLAEIIKDKVLNVLKEEQKAHERIDEVNTNLREVAMGSEKSDEDDMNTPDSENIDNSENLNDVPEEVDDNSDDQVEDTEESSEESSEEVDDIQEGVESFTKLLIGNLSKNEHKSLFTTLQNAACEQLITSSDTDELDPNEISARRLSNITFENTFTIFKHAKKDMFSALENLMAIQSAASQENFSNNKKKIFEAATNESVIIYTMLESLHTLNLIHPSMNDVKVAVESYTSMSMKNMNDKKILNSELSKTLRNTKMGIRNASSCDIEKACESLNRVKASLDIVKESCVTTENIIAMEEVLDMLNKKKDSMAIANESSIESYFDRRRHEGNVAQMLRVNSVLKRTMDPTAITFSQNRYSNELGVTIESLSGKAHTHVALEGYDGNVDEFRRIITDSVLMESNVPKIYLALNDGRGTKLQIKK